MRLQDCDLTKLTDLDIQAMALNDDEFYAELCLHIKTKDQRVTPFVYNEPQQIFTKSCTEQIKKQGYVQTIELKARQMGISTCVQGRGFKRATTTENFTMVNISHNDESVQHIFGMSQVFNDMLPPEMKPMVKYSPRTELYFANKDAAKNPGAGHGLRSSIRTASAKNPNVGRAPTIHFGHFSEVAFWQRDPAPLITGFMNAIPDPPVNPSHHWVPTEVHIESTANGPAGYFYELWVEAINGRSQWKPLFLPWWGMKTYRLKPKHKLNYDKHEDELREKYNLDDSQLQWRRYTMAKKCENDLSMFRQEYPASWREAFQSSAVSFFPVSLLETHLTALEKAPEPRRGFVERNVEKGIIFVDDPEGNAIIHQEPQGDMAYLLSADASEGTEDEEHDPSGFLVKTAPEDITKVSKEVFEYNGTLDPDTLADYMMLVGEWYNWAYLIWEDNNHGLLITRRVLEIGYGSFYEREKFDAKNQEITMQAGFRTTPSSKVLILDLLKKALKHGEAIPKCMAAVIELITFTKSKVAHKSGLYTGKAKAKGAHDERVIIRAMAELALTQCPRTPPNLGGSYEEDHEEYYAEGT